MHFNHGHTHILAALASCQERNSGNQDKKDLGEAISYRWKKDEKGWTVYATVKCQVPKPVTQKGLGAIGIDLNANHIVLVETDRFGNFIDSKTIPLNTYGKNPNQTQALNRRCSMLLLSKEL